MMIEKLTWDKVKGRELIYLYAGDIIGRPVSMSHFIGLSLTKNDRYHIIHDVRDTIPLPDNSVTFYQSEDVFEHIPYDSVPKIFEEIYRVLKEKCYFRLSMPDYRCDFLLNRSTKDKLGSIIFDSGGGGSPKNPGHIWFPNYEKVVWLFENSKFRNSYKVLHGYLPDGTPIMEEIDYNIGYILRTPDHDKRVQSPRRPMSIVVDAIKNVV
jgi:predicted SAM-dependent methyltransferase